MDNPRWDKFIIDEKPPTKEQLINFFVMSGEELNRPKEEIENTLITLHYLFDFGYKNGFDDGLINGLEMMSGK